MRAVLFYVCSVCAAFAVRAVRSMCSRCTAVRHLKGGAREEVAVSEGELHLDVNPVGLEHWYIGTLEHWDIETLELEHWDMGTLEHWDIAP